MELTWSRLKLRLLHTFVTATARRFEKQTLLVRIAHDGVEGFGEAVPVDTYGQTVESAERVLADAGGLLGDDPYRIDAIVDRLLERFDDQRATVAGIDAALHDWVGKKLNAPVVRWLGLDPSRAPLTSVTLGIDAPDMMRLKMRELARFPIWKVKIGMPRDAERELLGLIRGEAPDKTIRVDANTAWSADEALARLETVAAHRVELVEQPCRRDDFETTRRLKATGRVPIVADESCLVPADVERVSEAFDGINVKLSKCGGIREARRMIEAARGRGLRVMLGCMIESSLGVAAASQLAPLADWVDLDGHLLLADDPFTGLGGAGGRLTIGGSPGLGVRRRDSQGPEPR